MVLLKADAHQVGQQAPDFSLLNPSNGSMLTLDQCRGEKGLLVMVLCNHCPYVVHVMDGITKLSHDYEESGIGIMGFSANDPDNYPQDAPEKMAELAKGYGWKFPYLFDASQEVAKSFSAVCTPDFLLYDANLVCVYHGRFCPSTPSSGKEVTGSDLRQAMDLLLAGKPAIDKAEQSASMGCSIKWKSA